MKCSPKKVAYGVGEDPDYVLGEEVLEGWVSDGMEQLGNGSWAPLITLLLLMGSLPLTRLYLSQSRRRRRLLFVLLAEFLHGDCGTGVQQMLIATSPSAKTWEHNTS